MNRLLYLTICVLALITSCNSVSQEPTNNETQPSKSKYDFGKIKPIITTVSAKDSTIISIQIANYEGDSLFDFKFIVADDENKNSDTIYIDNSKRLTITRKILQPNHTFALQPGMHKIYGYYRPSSRIEAGWSKIYHSYTIE